MPNNAVETLNVESLFCGGKRYEIPLYQRAYAWKEKEITQLLEDILDITEDVSEYFLGSLIVDEKLDFYEVIDGQQRLTTLYLIMAYLGVKVGENLLFTCRNKSNFTLKNINKILNPLDSAIIDSVEGSILDGVDIIKRWFAGKKTDEIEKFENNLKRIYIHRIIVPQNTDLNRYFEVMNTRGEQLEQHDILKADLMSCLEKEEMLPFAKIWDACRDMTGYVQMHFDYSSSGNSDRERLFGKYWDCITADNIKNFLKSTMDNNKDGVGFKELLTDNFYIEDYEIDEKGDRVRFESIIEFTYFLLHLLRVFVNEKYNNYNIEFAIQIDDKKLTSEFESVIKTIGNDKKREFVLSFIEFLLIMRFKFDKYVIKREFRNENSVGEWSLKTLKINNDGYRRAYYVDTNFKKNKEHEKKYLKRHTANIKLQSCLRVSYTSPKVMHWITKYLEFIREKEPYEYEKCIEKDIIAPVIKEFISKDDNLYLGVKTQHIIFNYLDYCLFCENDTKDFDFKFRNSVEHWYPQNILKDGGYEKWDDVDYFGNLCIIERDNNSKFSNLPPESKKTAYKNIVENGSLKLRLMSEKTVDGATWKNSACKEHGEEMLNKLKKRLGFLLNDSSKTI